MKSFYSFRPIGLNILQFVATHVFLQVFMVFPRYREGACATLAKSSLLVPSGEPSWEPFPSWQAQTENDPNGLQNVIDVVLEQSPKNTLWVLDNGIVDTLTAPKLKCAPKVVGFDPTNGKVREFCSDPLSVIVHISPAFLL